MKSLFVHDHIFLKYNGRFYSNGKLTYSKLIEYLEYSDELKVIGRFKNIDNAPPLTSLSDGPNVTIIGVEGPLTVSGLINRRKLESLIKSYVSSVDIVFVRMPSELGMIALSIARKIGKKTIVEMVASPYDCLWYRGDLFAKLYAPFLHLRIKKELKSSQFVIYVTNKYLQSCYPTDGHSLAYSDVVIGSISPPKKAINKKIRIGIIANPAIKLKGVRVLYDAFLSLDNNRYELSVVGGGLNSNLEVEMAHHPNIEQLGFISSQVELERWFKTIDLYVQPSFTEGLPRSIIEAMSFSIPVIASRVGGIPELVHEDLLFEAGNSKELIKLMGDVSIPKKYYDYSIYSYETACRFSFSSQLEKRKLIVDYINGSL